MSGNRCRATPPLAKHPRGSNHPSSHRKVSLDPNGPGSPFDGGMMTMHSMNDYGMMDYGTMGMGMSSDPYNGGSSSFMPMHPAEAPAMGPSMMDQMMDFPPPTHSHFSMHPGRRMLSRNPPQPRSPMPVHPLIQDDIYAMNHRQSMMGHSPGMPNHHANADFVPEILVKRKERAPSSTSFPTKLYKILADPLYHDSIAWLPHGRAWRILKPKAFEEDVIPKFFRSDRYASFMRQVNGWGFKRITEGPDLNAYYHEMFLRGLPQVAAKMRRPVKGQINPSKELGQCPDFYKISLLAPLPSENCSLLEKKEEGEDLKESCERESRNIDEGESNARATCAAEESGTGINTEESHPSAPGPGSDAKTHDDMVSVASGAASIKGYMVPSAETPMGTPNRTIETAAAHPEYGFSGSASVGSWHDRQEPDFSWGPMSASSSAAGSPNGQGASLMVDGYRTQGVHNMYSQVTPPAHMRIPPNRGGFMPRSTSLMSLPYEDEPDNTGLSVADLAYLTNQNRILLSQAHKHHQK